MPIIGLYSVRPLGSRLTFGEAVAAVGGAVLLVALSFDWYAAERGGSANAVSAWEAFAVVDIALLAVALAPLALTALRFTDTDLDLRFPPGLIVAVAGAAGLALVLLRVVDLPDGLAARAPPGPFVGGSGVELGRRVGGFLALLACGGIAAGGWAAAAEPPAGFKGR